MPASDPSRARWARILLVLGVLGVAGAIYLWYFGEQTMWVLTARYIGWQVPIVKKTPRDLQDISMSRNPATTLSYFGYQFEVPWSDVDQSATKVTSNRVVISFHSGLSLMFYSGEPKAFVNDVLSQTDPKTFRQIYGDEALQSDYALTRMILESTPEKITPLTPEKDAVGINMLVMIKAIATPNADSGIFAIRTREFRGFQYEDPQRHPTRILADLFADDRSLEFIFFTKAKKPLVISQADINCVLQTVRKIDPQ